MRAKIRIVHVINSFEFGGAEAMLCNLLLHTDRERFEPSVISLIDDLTVAGPVIATGIPIITVGMKSGVPSLCGLARVARYLRKVRPDVVHTWMDHSNLIGGLAARMAIRTQIVWGIHHSDHLTGLTKNSTRMTVGACAALSHWMPSKILLCSEYSRASYIRAGFASDGMSVIPNAIDTTAFRPDAAAARGIRNELCVRPDAPIIAMVARYDPLKDHSTFLKSAAEIAARQPNAHFVLCGNRIDNDNAALRNQIHTLDLEGKCHLLGARRDVASICAAADLLVSSSLSEAFPMAICEAMACGTPCVVTNAGDSALIVGEAGRVVPRSDPHAIASACADLLSLAPAVRAQLGLLARNRICELFDLKTVTRRYEAIYQQLIHENLGRKAMTETHPRRWSAWPLGSILNKRAVG